ncbi:D-cysteine desulfhydrase family protein [Microbulbifer magnicolonia]|uniref:D-cysteine desulfhydrase family protein n=1 Tax=Microbulbifer magnicolonia TaxID=3109744 RepID=UPI002B404FE7|nr:D-cysteine desulfhydrase family protein [Microbulbifer sp. GG15]
MDHLSIDHLRRERLGFFPTPLTRLRNFTERFGGPEVYIKRDDQTGLALGGNKTRKLEFILGDALARGADTIITAGAAQSNHCRQTAAAAAALGLECHLVLGGHPPERASGNLLLDQLFGCHIHWNNVHRKGEDLPQVAEYLKQAGKKVYQVPYGGSSELGALAFVAALMELESQCRETALSFTHILFASSSGGTHAGLMLGKKLLDADFDIVGISIDKFENREIPFDRHIIELANRSAALIGSDQRFDSSDLHLNRDYLGEGYGVVGDQEREAIELLARTEGILLDPVYTGRAMAALIDLLRNNAFSKDDRVLFWHTGGAPALFAYADTLNISAPQPI